MPATAQTEEVKQGHTLGPWRVKDSRRPGQSIAICKGETSVELAYVPHHGKFSEANAALIAAAPDLLAALKTAEDVLDDMMPNDSVMDALKEARAAISKATGAK